MTVTIATWNVNSIKAREERVLNFLERESPDVLCLQELKVADEAFPYEAIAAAGYRAEVFGQRTYNGVAILAKGEPTDVRRGLGDDVEDDQARLIDATVDGVRIISAYFPNGQTVGSPKYEYKLAWMQRLRGYFERTASPATPLLVCGDMNVAPFEDDVAKPDQWSDSVLCHSAAREGLERVKAWGLTDVFRIDHPEGGVYSWWDYRMLAFPKGNGLRIDHILATQPMVHRYVGTRIDRNERKGKKPSDHVPVIGEFA